MRRLASAGLVVALTATAGLAFDRIFVRADLIPVVAVAAIVPALLSLALSGRGRPWPLWTSLVASVFAWLLVVTATLFREYALGGVLPSPESLRALGTGLRDSAKGMLTTILPAPGAPDLLVLVHVLVWFAVLSGTELAVRTPLTAVPAIPGLIVFVAAVFLGAAGTGGSLFSVAMHTALVALLVVVRNGTSARPVAGMAGAIVVGALAGAAAPYLPVAAEPYDPRDHVEPPEPRRFKNASPLDRVSGWLKNPSEPMFTVDAGRAENWRIATLDRFDGVTWSSSAEFKPTGMRVPPAVYGGARSKELRQRFRIQRLPGAWLPAADRPRTVEGVPVLVDPEGGVLVRPAADGGQSYVVVSDVPDFTAEELHGATVPGSARLPPGPDGRPVEQVARFTRIAAKATKGALTPLEKALRLRDYLRGMRLDPGGPPGHTYAQLEYFLGAGKGTTEQFGTAFAVLARAAGLGSRVVVGFRPGTVRDGAHQVVAGDVLVWAEIKFDRIGWVPFDPNPRKRDRSGGRSPVAGSMKEQEDVESKIDMAQPPTPSPTPSSPSPSPDPGQVGGAGIWPIAGLGAAALPVGYLGLVAVVPWWRRRRRRSGTPGQRVDGAWAATLEDLGLRTPATETAQDVASLGLSRVGEDGEDHLRRLADLVNLARYADLPLPDRCGELAWDESDAVRGLVRSRLPLRRRILRRLHPRSLFP